ncbi:MAG: hypothetical protein OXH68_07285 [Gammaproteobacteria bacterium]|nr:hypothetical protein [Gammaproteobacteria bacterium]
MGMFGRKDAEPVAAPVFDDDEGERVMAVWRLTALPREEFDATYGDLFQRCWRAVAAAPGAEWHALRDQALAHVTAALKVRRAYVLPRFAAAEDAARLAEAMSFALAACVLAERFARLLGRTTAPAWSPLRADVPAPAELSDMLVPRSFGGLLLTRLVGAAGHEWLAQEREALWAAAAYFGGGRSELREIADDAATRIGLPIADAAAEAPPAAREESVPEEPAPAVVAATPGPESDRAAEPPAVNSPSEVADAGSVVLETSDGTDGPLRVGGSGKGWLWMNWVRAGVHDGSIAVNAAGGWLHNVGGAAFVVVPDGYEAYRAPDSAAAKTVRNRVARLGRQRRRKWQGRTVDEFRAELADGRRVSGMVFPGDLVWDDRPPPASAAVVVEGRNW